MKRALKKNIQPWERQPGETARAFAAFVSFRSQPSETRAVKAARGAAEKQLYTWSSEWRWAERVAAWDRELDRQLQAEELAAQRSMQRRHARAGRRLQAWGLEALEAAKGRRSPKPPTSQIHRVVAEGVRLERLAYDKPTEIIGGDTDAELEALLRDPTLRSQLDLAASRLAGMESDASRDGGGAIDHADADGDSEAGVAALPSPEPPVSGTG